MWWCKIQWLTGLSSGKRQPLLELVKKETLRMRLFFFDLYFLAAVLPFLHFQIASQSLLFYLLSTCSRSILNCKAMAKCPRGELKSIKFNWVLPIERKLILFRGLQTTKTKSTKQPVKNKKLCKTKVSLLPLFLLDFTSYYFPNLCD